MSKTITKAMLQDVASGVNGSARVHYSGRGMFGKTCVGVVVDYGAEMELSDAINDAGANKILKKRGWKQDSMGLRTIIYWEDVQIADAGEDDA